MFYQFSFCLVFFSVSFNVHGLECEDYYQQTGTRKTSTCPVGDEFCVTAVNQYLGYELGPDGNFTNNVMWNITDEFGGCVSTFNATKTCDILGEECDIINDDPDHYFKFCCCKEDMCNKRTTTPKPATTTTDASASTDSTTTSENLLCEGYYQNSGTKKISSCPGDEFCVTLETFNFVYEIGPDGNATGNIVWNSTSEFRGCESNLQEVLYVEPDICKSNGDEDDCYEGVVENPGPDPVWTDMEWRICCCKGNLCNKGGSLTTSEGTTTTSVPTTSTQGTTTTSVSTTSTEATTTTSSSSSHVKMISLLLTLSTLAVSTCFS